MDVFDLEAEIHSGLTNDATLRPLLCENGVYHMRAPAGEAKRRPYIVYSVIANIPAVKGDNQELFARVTVRLHIVTNDGEYKGIFKAANAVMKSIGCMRASTDERVGVDGLRFLVADYRIGVNG